MLFRVIQHIQELGLGANFGNCLCFFLSLPFPVLLLGNVDASAHRSKHLDNCRHRWRCLSVLLHVLWTIQQYQKPHSLLTGIWSGKDFKCMMAQRHSGGYVLVSVSSVALITCPFSFEVARTGVWPDAFIFTMAFMIFYYLFSSEYGGLRFNFSSFERQNYSGKVLPNAT